MLDGDVRLLRAFDCLTTVVTDRWNVPFNMGAEFRLVAIVAVLGLLLHVREQGLDCGV